MNQDPISGLLDRTDPQAASAPASKRKRPPMKPVFKNYQQHQATLLPPNIGDRIPEGHLVRVVNDAIEQIKLPVLLKAYPGGGTSAFHPKMMLKVVVYAYLTKVFTSRPMAKAVRENLCFMWLAGGQTPSFHALNDFRSSRFGVMLDEVFASLLEFLIDKGYIKAETYFADGTKMRADANKFSYVWRKNAERYRNNVQKKIQEQLRYIDQLNRQEQAQYGENDLPEEGVNNPLSSADILEEIERLNRLLAPPPPGPPEPPSPDEGSGIPLSAPSEDERAASASTATCSSQLPAGNNEQTTTTTTTTTAISFSPLVPSSAEGRKKMVRALKTIINKHLPRLQQYEQQLACLGERNSYSKTDPAATFFRMKQSDELLPAYNVLLGTEEQWVLGFSVHPYAADNDCFIPHMNEVMASLHPGWKPKQIMTDCGFGTEEAHHFLHQQHIGNYLKYNTYHQEKKKQKKTPKYFSKDAFQYDKATDTFHCPGDHLLLFQKKSYPEKKSGFKSVVRIYQCSDCTGCLLQERCLRGKGNRTVQVNIRMDYYRAQARSNLDSPFGLLLRKKRGVDVEPTFADIKYNQGFHRFHLRSMPKVRVEVGLLSIAHNMKKLFQAKKAA